MPDSSRGVVYPISIASYVFTTYNKVYLERRGAACNESGSDFGYPMWERELQIGRHQLLDVRSANVSRLFDLHNAEDVYRPETSAVTGGHVLVKACHGIGATEVTEFLVHVVGAGTRIVS